MQLLEVEVEGANASQTFECNATQRHVAVWSLPGDVSRSSEVDPEHKYSRFFVAEKQKIRAHMRH